MRAIDFHRTPDGSYPFVSEELLSVMAFPAADDRLESARATFILERLVREHPAGAVPADAQLLRLVLDGQGLDETRKSAASRVVRGQIAGRVLRGLLEQHKRGVRPSIKELLRQEAIGLADYETFGGQRKAYRARSISSAWSEYRSVAHYWAVADILFERLVDAQAENGLEAVVGAARWMHLMHTNARGVIKEALRLLRAAAEVHLTSGAGEEPLLDHMSPWVPSGEYFKSQIEMAAD